MAEGRKAGAEERLADLIVAAMNETQPHRVTQWEEQEIVETQILDHARCRRCSRQLTAPEVHIWNGRPYGPTCITTITDGEGVEVVPLQEWLERNPLVTKSIMELPKGVIDLPQVSLWPDIDQVEMIDQHQRDELAKSLLGRIGILGGSPGTGKTHTTAQLVKALLKSGRVGPDDIAVGAPTGKATVRLNEVFHAAGVPVRAKTWHSLLGVGQADEETGGWSFHYGAANPWPFKVIIGDEEGNLGLLDFRITTFESGDGGLYSFDSRTTLNREVVEQVEGEARRLGSGVQVKLKQPSQKTVQLAGDTLFPSQHLQAILDAALANRKFVSADIYEGAGSGEASDAASAAIGRVLAAAPQGPLLRGGRHWPVSVGYFDGEKDTQASTALGEELPTYQMQFTLYENGVTNDLVMDYGNYALAGSLQQIEALEAPGCASR